MNSELALFITTVLLLAMVIALSSRLRSSEQDARSHLDAIEELRRERDEAKSQKRRADEIVEWMGEGVVVTDEDLRPILVNRSARQMLGLQRTDLPSRIPSEAVAEVARRAVAKADGAEALVTLWFPQRRAVRVRGTWLGDRGGVVVVMQDLTDDVRTQEIRREFVAHASHELKSPVAGLQALAEALQEALADDRVAALRFADRMRIEADRLGRLIGDLLDLSRLEEASKAPADEIDLVEVVRRETEAIRRVADEAGIELRIALTPVRVLGDDQNLRLMLRNLLDNAVRYTPAGGRIAIELGPRGGDAVIKVTDTGVGIPRASQERIFERFYRVDRGRSRDRGGTGLGLAIVKHAVELHGGAISLDSELGRGSTFTIKLPAVEPEHPTPSAAAG